MEKSAYNGHEERSASYSNEKTNGFVGHIVRQEGLECDILKGECSGKRLRGRNRYCSID